MPSHYVVYWNEQLRDGEEEGAKVVPNLAAAVALINKFAGGFGGGNTTYRLFELGREIPLEQTAVETPQPAVVKRAWVVADVSHDPVAPQHE